VKAGRLESALWLGIESDPGKLKVGERPVPRSMPV
jgi:hypothetical protein